LEPFTKPISRLIKDINTAILFSKPVQYPYQRGWLSRHVKTDWSPESQSWLYDDQVIQTFSELQNPPLLKSPLFHEKIRTEIKKLSLRTDIHILKADKGRNTVIWNISDYDKEANRQLSDHSTYKELSHEEFNNKLKEIKQTVCTISENLLALRLITATEDEAICDHPPTGSMIYFLPKIHKKMEPTSQTFPGRPIVATFTSVTYLLDKYITELTSDLLKRIPGSLIDTTDFIHRLPTGILPQHSLLVTADVTSLYPNIPWEAGIESSTKFYTDHFSLLQNIAQAKNKKKPPSPGLFFRILTLVLTNSMISFKNKRFFHQIKGTAMGCCISVYFANCYMYYTTRPLLDNPPRSLFLFLRFIDDLFFIITDSSDMDNLISTITDAHIGYEITPPSTKQHFLDTTVHISRKNTIILEPYSKDTASGAYLHPSSTHPKHTIAAIPFSQLLRLRRISSTKHIFRRHARHMIINFQNMGYNKQILLKTFRKTLKLKKHDLATKTTRSNTAEAFKFITTFNNIINWPKLQLTLNKLHSSILSYYIESESSTNQSLTDTLLTKPIRLVLSTDKKLSSYFSAVVKTGHKQ